jgi:hypothetical protein
MKLSWFTQAERVKLNEGELVHPSRKGEVWVKLNSRNDPGEICKYYKLVNHLHDRNDPGEI